jgi:serine/threonine protein kinase
MAKNENIELTEDPIIGQVFEDRYLIERKLGEGGVGSVYLANDSKMMGRKVVVKLLLDDWLRNPDVRRKFEHEKEALARLHHPSIVGILDAGMLEHGKPFIVMPYAEGRTLQAMIAEKFMLEWGESADIIESVTDALSAAHAKGILHRDVKPENIIVNALPNNRIRALLIDFGIARVFESEISPVTEMGRPLGTVLYVSPEQLDGNSVQTPASDVYSCGVVAYKMLTGHHAFEPQSVFEMLKLQSEGLKRVPSSYRSEIPQSIDAIISKALAFDPEERYQEAHNFGAELCRELRQLERESVGGGDLSEVTRVRPPRPAIQDSPTELHVPRPTHVYSGDKSINDLPTVSFGEAIPTRIGGPGGTNAGSLKTHVGFARRKPALAALALVVLGVLGGAGWLYYQQPSFNVQDPPPPVSAVATPSTDLQFYLLVNGGRERVKTEYRSDGNEVFKKGDSLQMILNSSAPGNLYIFSEEVVRANNPVAPVSGARQSASNGTPIFYLLYPIEIQNNGSPDVKAGDEVRTDILDFDGPPGREKVWIIWTREDVPEFEVARLSALSKGEVTDADAARGLRLFLGSYPQDQVATYKDDASMITTLSSGGNIIIHSLTLEHH